MPAGPEYRGGAGSRLEKCGMSTPHVDATTPALVSSVKVAADLRAAPPATADDVSRGLDGSPLDSEAVIVRHMADLEVRGLLTESRDPRMFRDLLGFSITTASPR